jgi:hypothetical protein
MQLAGAVEVKNGTEGLRVTVEEVLVVDEGIIVAEFADGFVRVAIPKSPQTSVWESLQRPPQHFMFDTPDIYAYPAIKRFGAHNHKGFRRK